MTRVVLCHRHTYGARAPKKFKTTDMTFALGIPLGAFSHNLAEEAKFVSLF
jgi:hypothetical protein